MEALCLDMLEYKYSVQGNLLKYCRHSLWNLKKAVSEAGEGNNPNGSHLTSGKGCGSDENHAYKFSQ